MRIAWTSLIPISSAVAAVAIACGGAATPAPPPAATPTVAAPTPVATPVRTGIRSVDDAIAAVLAGDEAALLKLVRYTPTACTRTPQGVGAPPACLPGEAEGAKVGVFPVARCEGSYTRPADTRLAIPRSVTLYGVYHAAARAWPAGNYVAIFERHDAEAAGLAWELILTDAGVVGVHLGCAMTPAQMVSFQRLTDAIVAPGGAAQ